MKLTEKFKIDAHERALRKSLIELARDGVVRLRKFGLPDLNKIIVLESGNRVFDRQGEES